MNVDDRVIYTEKHFDWLVQANVWPNSHLQIPRKQIIGRVLIAHPGKVLVNWSENLMYKVWDGRRNRLSDEVCFWHFTDNLEVLE